MRKNSLFGKYFAIFSLTTVVSIMVLGVILLVFVTQYFQSENYDSLRRNASQAAAITAANYAQNNYQAIDRPIVNTTYIVLSNSVGAEIFFADVAGEIRLHSGRTEGLEGTFVAQEIINHAIDDHFEMTTALSGIFAQAHYVVGVPVRVENTTIGVVFAATSAQNLKVFLKEMAKMFIISAAVVLFISTVALYGITMRLIEPLKSMLAATQSFTQGDFSKRVPVGGYDEIGQLAMSFNTMATTLAANEQTRRTFVANVSHELKTPMTTIGGFVDGILDGTVPEEKREQYLQIVSNEVKRLSRLIRSMLDSARIEAGEMDLNPVWFDISETVRQTVFVFEQAIEEKELEIRGLEIDKVMVRADVDLMHQVVYNLVENAVKFVNRGGYIEARYRNDGQRVYVAIRNSGEGLDRTEAPKLFERFYKSDKSRSQNTGGVGLGLHIVKNIMNYHKGEILVRSVENEYTEFEFCIPVPSKKEQQAAERTGKKI